MITAIRPGNQEDYKALYDEASDILSGFRRVRTYDGKVSDYYYKVDKKSVSTVEELYRKDETITDLYSFSQALGVRKILYVKDDKLKREAFNPLVGISTLEEYFSWLKDLADVSKKYTVLPLDEECFEINADTRVITIPASFKKNGIAVQGDDLAEIVYFKVDRYYDYMDLNNTSIYIQWETPKAVGSGESVKSLSPAYYVDIESEPGKLIFGWVLDKSITQNSGTLKFSVRFFQWEDPKAAENGADTILAYSLSTLTASVSINPALNFNINGSQQVEDAGLRIVNRLQNSKIVGGYAAATPAFNLDLNDTIEYDLDEITKDYTLTVNAYATDTGSISYSWYRTGLDEYNSTQGQDVLPVSHKNVYVEAEDVTKLNKNYAYYFYAGGDAAGEPVYSLYRGGYVNNPDGITKSVTQTALEEGIVLYERQSQCTVTEAGSYQAIAENRITNSVTPAKSKTALFPLPTHVNISKELNPRGTLEKIANEEGVFECPLSTEANNTDGYLTYKWQRHADYSQSFDYEAEKNNFVDVTEDLRDNEGFKATEPGHYRAIITNHRNEEIKTKETGICRVTHKPEMPELATLGETERNFEISKLNSTNCPKVIILPEGIESDMYTVEWYHEEIPFVIKKEILPEGVYTSSFNPDDDEYRNVIMDNSPVDHDIDGRYYAIVTNIVNEVSIEKPKTEGQNMFLVL